MTGIYLVVVIPCVAYFAHHARDEIAATLAAIVGTAVYIVVVALTGTKPGGRMRF